MGKTLCQGDARGFSPASHIQGAMITDKGDNRAKGTRLNPGRRSPMKARNRFLKSVISAAKTETTQMPWSRGTVRAAHVTQRRNTQGSQAEPLRLKRA
jgi:hypothetical protein